MQAPPGWAGLAGAQPAQPFARESGRPPKDPAPITGPRDLLRRYGIDDSQFNRIVDGRPVAEDEYELLWKLMFRIRDFGMLQIERWARKELNLSQLAKQPEAGRGQLYALAGRVTRVEVLRPVPEVVERFQMERYYRCRLVLSDGQPAEVFSRTVPEAWQAGGELDARASAYGLLLKFAGEDADRPRPVFVAPRVAWHPPILLGDLGMDVGLLDDVENGEGLSGRDREAFYQMLAAAGRARPGLLLKKAKQALKTAEQGLKRTDEEGREHFSVVPLFNEAEHQHGRLVALSGIARRVVRIAVHDPDIVERFGIDHYYEMGLFTDDSQGNPLVFCVRRLPDGMPVGDGPHYAERVEVAGFFFKTWAYRVRPPETVGADRGGRIRRQLAPLLIGRQPVWYPQQPPSGNPLAAAIAAGLFLCVLVGIWLALWRYGRSDRQFLERTLAKAYSIDSDVSLDEIGLSANGLPDSSGPEQTKHGSDPGQS